VTKLAIALVATLYADARGSWSKLASICREEIVAEGGRRDMLLLTLPAVLYTVQNNLHYVATSHMSAPLFQVLVPVPVPVL